MQWAPFNGITDNVINHFIRSIFLRPFGNKGNSQPKEYVRLMLSFSNCNQIRLAQGDPIKQ